MKRTLFASLIVSFIVASQAIAYDYQETAKQNEAQSNGWWPLLQIVFWPGIPPYTEKAVYGVRTGFPVSGGTGAVDGIEITPVLSYSDYVYGVQISGFMNHSKITEGFHCGFVNASTEWTKGLQLSAINLNFQNSTGVDLAVVNATSKNMRGVQLGVVNYVSNQKGLQFGVFNVAEWSSIQFGLINIIQNGWLPFFPFFNFSFK